MNMKLNIKIYFLCLMISLIPNLSFAYTWKDLWYSPNQQGAKLLLQNQPKQAAKKFVNPEWRAVADYRAGKYQAALKAFSEKDSAKTNYNRGNALAHLGKLKAAIAAYDAAIKQKSDFADAIHNKKVLEKILKQQPPKNNKHNQNNNKQNKNNQKNNKQNKKNQPNKNQKQNKEKNKQNQKNQQNQKRQNKDNNNQQQQKKNPNNDNKKQSQQKQQSQSNKNQNQHKNNNKKNNNAPQQSNQQKQQQKKSQQHNQAKAPKSQNNQPKSKTHKQPESSQPKLTSQQQQNLKQWLQQIPDDPGGLLRQKFLRDHMRLQQQRRL